MEGAQLRDKLCIYAASLVLGSLMAVARWGSELAPAHPGSIQAPGKGIATEL